MAILTVQQITRAGIAPSSVAGDAAGDSFPNTGQEFLRVANGDAVVARTVTITSQLTAGATPQGATKTDLTVNVPASGERWVGPFDPAAFNDANGRVVVTYDDEADISVSAFAL